MIVLPLNSIPLVVGISNIKQNSVNLKTVPQNRFVKARKFPID